jgi:hypothetical protein
VENGGVLRHHQIGAAVSNMIRNTQTIKLSNTQTIRLKID